jgi:hypothetical protein
MILSLCVQQVGLDVDVVHWTASVAVGKEPEIWRKSGRSDSATWPSDLCELLHEINGLFTPVSDGVCE